MSVSIDQLRTRLTRSQSIEFITSTLTLLGFNATNWKKDSNQFKFLRAFATCWSDSTELVRQLAGFGVNRYANGSPLEELSRSNFGNTAHPATKTVGPVKLTNTGQTPYTLAVGQLLFQSTTGVDFRLTALPNGGSLAAAGGTLVVTVEALIAGIGGNVANGTITKLVTSLAGVTCTNEGGLDGSPWYTSSGNDKESPEALRQRNEDKIATLNPIALPGDAYRLLAMSVPGIERVKVDDLNPRGPNTLDIYIATANGPAGTTDINAVQALIGAKRSPGDDVLVKAPTNLVLNPAGTVWFARGFRTEARQRELLRQVDDYINGVPIGGLIFPPSTSGVFPLSELTTAMSAIPGVERVDFTNPTVNVGMQAYQLMVTGDNTGIVFGEM